MALSQDHMKKMALAHSIGAAVPASVIKAWNNESFETKMRKAHAIGGYIPRDVARRNLNVEESQRSFQQAANH